MLLIRTLGWVEVRDKVRADVMNGYLWHNESSKLLCESHYGIIVA